MIHETGGLAFSPGSRNAERPKLTDPEKTLDRNTVTLPDDSGERMPDWEDGLFRLTLPDDSGERMPDREDGLFRLTLPDDSGERMPQKKADTALETVCTGGSYKDVKNQVDASEKKDVEVHHIPADSASHLDRSEGPAIEMEKVDHRRTASCGNSREAIEYRNKQRDLIEKGDFQGAVQMDIDDIRMKFGSKYDEQIKQMQSYVDKLKKEGKI